MAKPKLELATRVPGNAPLAAMPRPGETRMLLTAEEVAELIGMGVDWVYAESRNGRIPTVKLGRYRRYRREAIEAWLRQLEA